MIGRWLATRAWRRGEPSYVVGPEGEYVQLPEPDDNDMVSGEDLEVLLAAIGISVEEWEQAGIAERESRIKFVYVVSAITGLIGAVLLFGGWSNIVGAAATTVAVLALACAVAMKCRAGREG